MLVLSRQPNEAIVIHDTVRITVVAVKGDRVRLGIEAPRDVPVDRAEVHTRKIQFVDVPLATAAVCDESVDLGGGVTAR
ncbi:MAG TPA: carbon storage regulator [Gemmataceae bacterium]|jgi:carbon storage regulator|nr:carbon storage regulator [Gemmataceae bacterium]